MFKSIYDYKILFNQYVENDYTSENYINNRAKVEINERIIN